MATIRYHHRSVADVLLGREAGGLPLESALGLTFLSCLVLAAAVASGVVVGTPAIGTMVLVVVIVAWCSAPATAVLVAILAFLFVDGFVVDTAGTLTWHGDADLALIASMVVVAVTAALLGGRRRTIKDPSRAERPASTVHMSAGIRNLAGSSLAPGPDRSCPSRRK